MTRLNFSTTKSNVDDKIKIMCGIFKLIILHLALTLTLYDCLVVGVLNDHIHCIMIIHKNNMNNTIQNSDRLLDCI